MDSLVILGLVVASFLVTIAGSVYFSVTSMSNAPELRLAPELNASIAGSLPANVVPFLHAQGFRLAQTYRFHSMSLGKWVQPGGPPVQCFFLTRSAVGTSYEFVAVFSDDESLTTTKTRSAFLFPRTFGGFLQSFPGASIDALWEAHLRGTQHLRSEMSIAAKECRLPYEERFRRGTLKQLSYIRSLPFWPVRAVYWYLLKRFLMHNRPIWNQDIARIYPRFPDVA